MIQGIGDDAAVLKTAAEPVPYLLVTADNMMENRHFKRQWATPEQIGFKAAESNVSDIAAMGGTAHWLVVSLALPRDIEVDWVERLYRGLVDSCQRHGVAVVGGDTIQGPVVTISITLLGRVEPQNLCLRSDAQIGDHLMVTGQLGAPAAAIALLDKGIQPLVQVHEFSQGKKYRYHIRRQTECPSASADAPEQKPFQMGGFPRPWISQNNNTRPV